MLKRTLPYMLNIILCVAVVTVLAITLSFNGYASELGGISENEISDEEISTEVEADEIAGDIILTDVTSAPEETESITPAADRKAGKLIPKETYNPFKVPDEIIVNGKVHDTKTIPDDIDINSLEPSSVYVADMLRRYFEGTASEKEQRALITISENAGGMFLNHPKYGFIDLGQQIMKELNIQDSKMSKTLSEKDEYDKRFRQEFLLDKFQAKTITEGELKEFEQICEEGGILVHGLHLYYMNPDVQIMYDEVKDIVKIEIKSMEGDPSTKYISVEDYRTLETEYNKKMAITKMSMQTKVSESAPFDYEFTEEEMIIEDENSPYLQYLITLYLNDQINEEEKALLDEAMELFGLVIIEPED